VGSEEGKRKGYGERRSGCPSGNHSFLNPKGGRPEAGKKGKEGNARSAIAFATDSGERKKRRGDGGDCADI